EHAGRGELDLHAGLGVRVPGTQRPDVLGGDVRPVLGAEEVLQEDLEAERQPLVPGYLVELVDLVASATDAELAPRTEAVEARHVALLCRRRPLRGKLPAPRRRGGLRSPNGARLHSKPYVRLIFSSSRHACLQKSMMFDLLTPRLTLSLDLCR